MIIDQDAVRSLERAKKHRLPEVDPPEMIMEQDASPRVDEERGAEAPSRSYSRRRRGARRAVTIFDHDEALGRYVDMYV